MSTGLTRVGSIRPSSFQIESTNHFLFFNATIGVLDQEQRTAEEKGILDEMAACQAHDGFFEGGKATLVFRFLC
jgi:hypothetical protein